MLQKRLPIQLGSQSIPIKITDLETMQAHNKNALWIAICNYMNWPPSVIRQFKEDVFTGRIDANDWNVAAKGEDSGMTPLFLLVQFATVRQATTVSRNDAWEFLQELVEKDALPLECWDAHAQGMSPLLMIMASALVGNKNAWRFLKILTEKEKLTVAHWNAVGRLDKYGQITPFGVFIIALCANVENSEEFLKLLCAHLDFSASLSTQIIHDGITFTLLEYLICNEDRKFLALLIENNCWPNIDQWRLEVSNPKRSAIWLLIDQARCKDRAAHRMLEKVIPNIAWTPEIWNTIPLDRRDNPITALWLLVASIKCGENAAGLVEFSQLIEQNCVTREGLQVSEKTGVNAGQTIPWLLLGISESAPELVWDVLKKLVDRRLIDKSTWNMPDEKNGFTPIYLLFGHALYSQRAFEILIELIDQELVDKVALHTRIKAHNTTLIDAVVTLANDGNKVALALVGHCAAAGIGDFSFLAFTDGSTFEMFSKDPTRWQKIEEIFDALTASNVAAVAVAQKYIARLHAVADAATADTAPEKQKFIVEFKIKLYVMHEKYFLRCGLVLQAIAQVEAAVAHNAKNIGVNEIFAGFCDIIEYYKTHPEGRWLQAYKLGQQCLAYLSNVKNKKLKVKKIEGEIKELKEIYLRNVSKDSRWQLTENHDFSLVLTESQVQAIQDGSSVLSVLFNNVTFVLDEDAKVLIIRNPIEMDQSLLSAILTASDDGLFVVRMRRPSPESPAEDALVENFSQCSLDSDFKRGPAPKGKAKIDPDAPQPYFLQDEESMLDDERLALPTPSITVSDVEYFWPPITVTSTSDSRFAQFVTVKRELLDAHEDLRRIFDPERKQIRFLRNDEVGAHDGAKRCETDTPEGPRPTLLLKYCNKHGDETRSLATEIKPRTGVYEVTEKSFDHKEQDRRIKNGEIRFN